MAAMIFSAWPGVKRTGSGCVGTDDGSARARGPHGQVDGGEQVHGPTRAEGPDERAVDPEGTPDIGTRRAGDTPTDRRSAAWGTCAWAPQMTLAIAAGPVSVAGSIRSCRAIRRAVTPFQVTTVGWGRLTRGPRSRPATGPCRRPGVAYRPT